jgi:hypothetical protein
VNKGYKIPLQQRKNLLSLAVARFQDLEDFPLSVATLFTGNDTRVYHSLFDDITRKYTEKTMPGDFIDSHIKDVSESKRKKIILSFEQKSLLTEFHSYAFNVKLGNKVVYSTSSSTAIDLKSSEVLKVCRYIDINPCYYCILYEPLTLCNPWDFI